MAIRRVSQEEPLEGYRLLERLGRGGFGEVWKVEAPGGLQKAMKFVFGDLDAADEDGRPAEQELKALHRVKMIRHPYILSLERFDIVDGQLIIVMELADRNLWDRFRECRQQNLTGIPREELLNYMMETAEALDLMNDQYQIQHLDIKPQNIFLIHKHIKVADFGLAKAFEGVRGTVTGGVTPVYAAPETFEGWISRFTDQYSLAIVFQELLSGTRPFQGNNTKQLLLQHLNAQPDLSSMPEADRPILARALEKKPEVRWPSCTEMVQALLATGSLELPLRVQPAGPKPNLPSNPSQVPTQDPAMSLPIDSLSPTGISPEAVSAPTAAPPQDSPNPSHTPSAVNSTPLPSLVTPRRLVTPKQAGLSGFTPGATIQRPAVFETGRMTTSAIAPPERTGSGVLFPALIVGIGGTGLAMLKSLLGIVRSDWNRTEQLPHLRFLYIDTDSDSTSASLEGDYPLLSREVINAKLNRPTHYLQREGLPPFEGWLPPSLLYRLPKQPTCSGGRAGLRPAGLVRPLPAHCPAGPAVGRNLFGRSPTGSSRRTDRPRPGHESATGLLAL